MLTNYDQKTSAHHEDHEGHEGSEFESLFFVSFVPFVVKIFPPNFAPLRSFDFAQDMLCGRYSESRRNL
jgi:hypothetical protein